MESTMGETLVVRMPRFDLDRLSTRQKLALIERLWDSIEEADVPPLSKAEREELDRRIAEVDSGRARAVPWERVRKELRKGLRRRAR
jgi:putative addiction module component (TIGR02574 family)